jgi:hypothetical protein
MLEDVVDLWTEEAPAKCITINGTLKKGNRLVMGAGVAGQAESRYPDFPKIAGKYIAKNGNHVTFYGAWYLRGQHIAQARPEDVFYFITFPVKYNWYEDADLELIERSSKELMQLLDQHPWKKVLLPRPGCGYGHLKWEDVKPVIEPILDDRVVVIRNSY